MTIQPGSGAEKPTTRAASLENRYSWAVFRVADGTIVETGPVLAVDTLARWSPDGRQIMVLNVNLGHSQLILDPDGGPPRTVPWSAVGGDWQRMVP
jgi:hypothetical protein